MVRVEVCVETLSGVRAARAAGAEAVELCAGLGEGGVTASAGFLGAAAALGGIAVRALVRPRPGDFLYDAEEHALALRDVGLAREHPIAGVALGVLTPQGDVDVECTAELVARARPLAVTFHRAFDFVRDREAALELLIDLGVERVLTAGGAATAWEGRASLAELVRLARGRIGIVAAGGVRGDHARALVEETGVAEVHLALPRRVEGRMLHRAEGPRLTSANRAAEAFAHWDTDEAGLRAFVASLAK